MPVPPSRITPHFSCHLAPVSPQKRVEAMIGQPTSKPTCPNCGAEVPADAPRGYCLKCLFRLGTAEPENGEQKLESENVEERSLSPLPHLTPLPGPLLVEGRG